MKYRIAFFVLLMGLMASGASFAAWRHLTQLPDWYKQPQVSTEEPPVISQQDFDESNERNILETQLKQKLQPIQAQGSASRSTIKLNEQDVNELIVVSANQSNQTQAYLDGIQGIKTEISAQKIKSEIVINFSQVDRDRLPQNHVQVLEELAAQFPLLADKDILLSFDGKPQIVKGQLQLDPAMKVAIGGFQVTLSEFSKRLGIDMESTPISLKVSDLGIEDLQYSDGELYLNHLQ